MHETTTLNARAIETLAFDALTASGTSASNARSLAAAVAAAELDGIPSHGLAYVPTYCEHVRCGKVVGDAVPRLEALTDVAFRVDAGSGFAHPAIDAGLEAIIAAARTHAIAAVAVHNSYNCGVLGYHTQHLAGAGLLGLGFTNAPASIAPVDGQRPVIGTNPFSLAVPGAGDGETALLVDQSASVIAKSEVMAYARRGETLPEGWAKDAEGHPTTDPEAALAGGTMMPAGGYKGFGAGLMVETLAAALSGAVLGIDASPFSGTAGGPPRTGQCFIAIDPVRFSGGAFDIRVAALLDAIAAQAGARVPGRRRHANRERHSAQGVAVPTELVARIQALAKPD